MEFLGSLAKQFIFFSGDVQTTTIAMAITGSLCCSIMAAIVQVISWANAQPISEQKSQAELLSLVSGEKYDGLKWTEDSTVPAGDPGEVSGVRRGSRPPSPPPHHTPAHSCSSSFDRRLGSDTCEDCLSGRCGTLGSDVLSSTGPSPLRVNKHVVMDLSFQRLDQWPCRLGFVGTGLRRLNLSHNNLSEIPAEMGCLSGLRHLGLANNKLRSLPPTMASLRQLETLDLRSNRFTAIPECVFSLSSLATLLLSRNCLLAISGDLKNLITLRRLAIDRNRLEALPDQLCRLTDLQVLDSSHNPLGRLPAGVGELIRLRELTLTSCRLSCLPDSLTRCAALRVLEASYNRLTAVPVQIGRLHGLRELYLHNNNISTFPASLAGLSLQRFTVHNNLFISDRDGQENLSIVPAVEFPPLLELTARFIAQQEMPWKTSDLPDSLKGQLRDCRQCSRCEGPCFRYYSSSVTRRRVGPAGQLLPLVYVACSPHSFCHFRP